MKQYKIIILLLLSVFSVQFLFAQNEKVAMADVLRSNGKIYAVVAVCLTILVGLFLYVWKVDRRITKMEKEGVGN